MGTYATIHCDVVSSDNIRTEWKRTVSIPFTPWVGLKIRDMGDARDPHTVDEIEWSLKDQEWTLFCEGEEWIDKARTGVVAEMISDGWTLESEVDLNGIK